MVVLIRVGNSEGERTCDSRCYDASSPASECECCCNGMNHGVGAAMASLNTTRHGHTLVDQYVKANNLEGTGWWSAVQRNLDLFQGGSNG